MALQLTKHDIINLREKAERMQNYAKRTLERSKQVVTRVVTTIEVSAAAFGWGIAKGRWGEVELFGAPLSLVAGLGLHILGFFGVAGNMSGHLHAFADGSLASWATTTGVQAGDAWAKKVGAPPALPGADKGALPGAKASGVDIDRAIARAVAGA